MDQLLLHRLRVAIDALYKALTEINAQGVAILLVEQNVKRALGICDHAVVLRGGLAVASVDATEMAGEGGARAYRALLG